jgi:hypothetical protein
LHGSVRRFALAIKEFVSIFRADVMKAAPRLGDEARQGASLDRINSISYGAFWSLVAGARF